jgi:hypothetical protein
VTLEAANNVLEAMRSRNRVDFGRRPPIPLREPTLTRPDPVPTTISKPIIAHRRGTCGLCHKRIWEGNDDEFGDEIVEVSGKGWCHVFCIPDEEDAPAYATSGVSWPD